jgi:FtsP/CotA-like multicopper oxidase with cupredoxin domain
MAALASGSLLVAGLPASGAAAVTSLAAVTGAAPLAPAPAAGKLTPRGCTSTGTSSVRCDLYAMTGTATVAGNKLPIWGFSSTGAATTASAPGPLLVVQQGSSVTLSLHNRLPGETVSLALPGQTGLGGDDVNGVASGVDKSYTFTASRPGTYIYEAGHTANGSRQVAMGLAGALVVLSSTGTAEGTPESTYNDDAVLVLSEIDPALNAAPNSFDMRGFNPRYRLVNGEAFPETNEVATDQGHKVLIRYANVGSQTHSMTVLGGTQTELALGGHPLQFPGTVVTEVIQPGQTVDAAVTMPTGPEAKLAVYEPAQHLDNDSTHTADPLQTAFGGMLTFLDTAAPPPSTDGVGPVSSHVSVSPSPSDGKTDVTVTADLSDATTGGSAVSEAEFVVDDPTATGVGFATPMSGAFGSVNVNGVTGTLHASLVNPPVGTPTLESLAAGKRIIYVRAKDSSGNWGVVGSVVFNLPKTGPQTTNGSALDIPANGASDVDISATGDDSAAGGTITDGEYFIDNPSGLSGTGVHIVPSSTGTVVSLDATLLAASVKLLGEGMHHVYVRSMDSLGLWGPLLDIPLPVDLTGPGVDSASVGPNPTNGVVSDKSNPGFLLVSAQITDKDAGGAKQNRLVGAEAFLEPKLANPPTGSGLQLIPVDGAFDSSTESVYGLIPLSQVKSLADGQRHVLVRGQDAAGNWGDLFTITLTVDKTGPVLGALTVTPGIPATPRTVTLKATVTDASSIKTVEYWIGTTDPGVGRGTSVPVSVVGGQLVATASLPATMFGAQQFNLRAQDLPGNWSKPASVSYNVPKPNLVFTDLFESGNLNAWTTRVGGVTSTSGSKVPTSAELGSARGMQVAVPATGTNRLAYVTDTTPGAETSYHARFAFNRNTLNSGSAATVFTVFETRNATNGSAFSLQYRLAAGVPQLRTVLAVNGGLTATGGWVAIATGARLVQLDWLAAAAGSVKLSIDGALVQTVSGNNSTLRVDTALLGVSAGPTTTSAGGGTAFFDSFLSTRTTMP